MGRKTPESFVKRQRELRKKERAAMKRKQRLDRKEAGEDGPKEEVYELPQPITEDGIAPPPIIVRAKDGKVLRDQDEG